jgi:cytochrome c5
MSGRAITLAGLALFAVLAIGWTMLTHHLDPAASSPAMASAAAVSGNGITLTSAAITLPEERVALPAGSDLVTANCTACHSPEMLTTQPVLGAEKWQATIDKMRTVYKAPIAPADDAALVAALLALPTQRPPARR